VQLAPTCEALSARRDKSGTPCDDSLWLVRAKVVNVARINREKWLKRACCVRDQVRPEALGIYDETLGDIEPWVANGLGTRPNSVCPRCLTEAGLEALKSDDQQRMEMRAANRPRRR
jgi:hypothetical protein